MLIGLLFLGSVFSMCPTDDKLCQKCDGTRCMYCVYSYPGADGACVATEAVPGCYSYKSATECEDCQPGYHQESTTSCVKFTEEFGAKCYLSWSTADVCNVCKDRAYWNADTKQCDTATTCTDVNCAYCAEKTEGKYCYRCATGYSIWAIGNVGTGSTCVANTVAGCLVTANPGECHTCDFGYYISGTTCVASAALDLSVTIKSVISIVTLLALQLF